MSRLHQSAYRCGERAGSHTGQDMCKFRPEISKAEAPREPLSHPAQPPPTVVSGARYSFPLMSSWRETDTDQAPYADTGLGTVQEPQLLCLLHLTRFFSQGRSRMTSSSVKGPQVATGLPFWVLAPPTVSSWAWQLLCSGVTVSTVVSGTTVGMGTWVRWRRACSARSKHTWRFRSCCCRALSRPLRTEGRCTQRATTSSRTRF